MSDWDESVRRTMERLRPELERHILEPNPLLEWLPRPIPVPWWRKLLHPRFYLRGWVVERRRWLADKIDPDK
jgi:hypothetical protein